MTSLDKLTYPGPSARFPIASAHIAMEALWGVSVIVTRRTNAWIWSARHARGDDRTAMHLSRCFDLRTRQEFWVCQHCLAREAIALPGEIDQRWIPRPGKDEGQAYVDTCSAFIDRHVDCRVNEPTP